MNIEYFHDDGHVIACIDHGSGGMFTTNPGTAGWSFINPGSLAWDSYHQNIYRNHHDFAPCDPAMIARLPPLPPVPDHQTISWADNFKLEKKAKAQEFKCCADFLRRQADCSARVWFTLSEDCYESAFGDGVFRYYDHRVFLTEPDAAAFGESAYLYFVRSCKLVLVGEMFDSPDCRPDNYEHYRLDEILADLEKLLSARK
jgi:hypothetical protein